MYDERDYQLKIGLLLVVDKRNEEQQLKQVEKSPVLQLETKEEYAYRTEKILVYGFITNKEITFEEDLKDVI